MRNDGGTAFPQFPPADGSDRVLYNAEIVDGRMVGGYWKSNCAGMSLRDWFAGQALQGMMMTADPWGAAESGSAHWIVTAKIAYACADAMIAEREKS